MPAAMPIYLRPRPPAHRELWRHAAGAYGAWAAVWILLATDGAMASLEGHHATWVAARVGAIGLAVAYGIGVAAIAMLLFSVRSVALNAFGVAVWMVTPSVVYGAGFSGKAPGNDLLLQYMFMTAFALVTAALLSAVFPALPSMRHREARQAGVVLLLLALMWVVAVRTSMLPSVWNTGNVDLVVFLPIVLACLGIAGPVGVVRVRMPHLVTAPQDTMEGAPAYAPLASMPAGPPPLPPSRPTEVGAVPRATRLPQPAQVAPLRLADVVLPEPTRLELEVLIRLLNERDSGARFGLEPPQGAIFYGPPGTGKTMIARAIAGETGHAVLAYSGAELVSMWIGESAQLIRDMFSQARATAPSVLFIDELDGIAPVRGGSDMGSPAGQDARARMAELLHALEGVGGALAGVFVIGATNRLTDVDPAIRSRLGYHVEIGLPDEPARAQILRLWLPPQAAVTPEEIAHLAQGMSGRDLRELCRTAAMLAYAERAPQVTREHFERALRRIATEPGVHAGRAATANRIEQASFADLVLPEGVLRELSTLVRLIADPEAGRGLAVAPPLGAILHGPPGTGKTLIARAVAGESRRPVLAFSGADITSMLLGEGTQLVRDMFQQARSQAPCILFIDELDGVTPSRRARSGMEIGHATQDATQRINQFLQELEGVGGGSAGVFVIGATNHLDAIDPAVSSRLSYQLAIPLPDIAARTEILRRHFPQQTTVTPADVAAMTDGYSGRDLRELCRIAGMIAVSEGAGEVTLQHFTVARERIGRHIEEE